LKTLNFENPNLKIYKFATGICINHLQKRSKVRSLSLQMNACNKNLGPN